MFTREVIIVLCLLLFMVVGLLTHFLPYGVIGMTCCVVLVLTGINDIPTAFAGFSSGNTIMIACMIVVASVLGNTRPMGKLRESLSHLQGKSGIFLILMLFAILIPLSQFMGQMACLSILLLFAQTLDDESEICPGRIFFILCIMNCMWVSRFPIGMGVAMYGMTNSLYEGLVGPEDLLGIYDLFRIGIIPSIVGTIYCLLFYRLIPKTKITGDQNAVKSYEKLPIKDEIVIWAVFFAVTGGFAFQKQLGSNISNIMPAAGVLALIIFKVLPAEKVVKILTSDMIWMVAGMQTMSAAMASTGVGELIGKGVLTILGSNPSGLFVMVVFAVFATIMTNFLSNFGTMGVLCPIAASTALAGGMNVKSIVLVVTAASWLTAFIMPTGSSGAIMAYGTGNHNPLKTMKFTLPLVALLLVTLIICANIFYPIYS